MLEALLNNPFPWTPKRLARSWLELGANLSTVRPRSLAGAGCTAGRQTDEERHRGRFYGAIRQCSPAPPPT